jgi:LAO/AO transport system kinase
MGLSEAVLSGERLALARLITQIENDTDPGRKVLDELFPYTGKAHLIGVTGSPGTGKSTLVNQLAKYFRSPSNGQDRRKVGIIAVDPSSPFTGGAILGDRVRMRDLTGDAGVFIRSMATRGALGGLARATTGVAQAMDAAGFEVILIETVGAGQSEVDIARLAHTTLVVEAPGLGDDIQAIKAGILEIADILVINKADLPGVENTERALRSNLEMGHALKSGEDHDRFHNVRASISILADDSGWTPPIVRSIAAKGEGITELADIINKHAVYLKTTNQWQQREHNRLKTELKLYIMDRLYQTWREQVPESIFEQALEGVLQRKRSPFETIEQLLQKSMLKF